MTTRRTFLKSLARNTFRRLGYDISRFSPHARAGLGVDPFRDMEKLLSGNERPVVLDVGANEGQSVKAFKDVSPRCEIHSFEPSPSTHEKLVRRVNAYPDVFPNNLGVGSSCGMMRFLENQRSTMSSFLEPDEACLGEIVNELPVEVITLDSYCERKSVRYVNILKTDTQGYDFEVLKGARSLMVKNRIQMIFTEVIFSKMYRDLPDFDEVYRFLLDNNFKLVSFYSFYYFDNLASWSDALFLNPKFSPNDQA